VQNLARLPASILRRYRSLGAIPAFILKTTADGD
jgi:hypothetical protein